MNLSNFFLSKDFKKKEKKRKNYSFGYIDCTDQLDTLIVLTNLIQWGLNPMYTHLSKYDVFSLILSF